jgi:cytochrome c556
MRVALITATASLVLIAAAPPARNQLLRVMHERHEGMEAIGKANKAAGRTIRSDAPDLAIVRASAAQINVLARRSSGWFPAGTGPELGKTGAKPEIWHDASDFAAKLKDFQNKAQAFDAAARGNDVNMAKARFVDLEHACSACHDKYRAEMHH